MIPVGLYIADVVALTSQDPMQAIVRPIHVITSQVNLYDHRTSTLHADGRLTMAITCFAVGASRCKNRPYGRTVGLRARV